MEAYQLCKSSDMQLLSFEDETEYKFFFAHINEASNFQKYANDPIWAPARQIIYFGAFSKVLLSKTGFIWYDTGKPLDYMMEWGTGQPNNAGGNQYCASFILGYGPGYTANDYQCFGASFKFSFICQKFTGMNRGLKPKS